MEVLKIGHIKTRVNISILCFIFIFFKEKSLHQFENGDANLSTCSLSSQTRFFPNGFFFDRAITSSIQFIFILKVYIKYHKICCTEN